MPIPKEIADLVQAYEYHRAAYHRGQDRFNEAQLRIQFVDPFFRALGWDVGNTQQSAPRYLEVVVNDPINVHGKTLFLDYSFRYGENRKFIVETKKPSVKIEDDAASALQLRRYAWNEKITLSILTNFEEFAIYDCTVKPLHGDSAGVARRAIFSYKDYPEKWDEIEKIFSKESIRKGSFDDFAKSTKGRRGTVSVDEDLLSEIEKWRDLLAKNIALRNKLTVNELNTVVQRTIDRILFLKICEDRNIEENGTLLELTNNDEIYSHLCDLFRKADEKYNSGLFHFQKEPGWDELPDTLSLILKIDDKILKDIIKDLYPPRSLYLFNVIPPAILGQVYEQFLGKVIRLTESGQAKIDFKPEVKKAGGVFYTPEFIVQYIVQQTVGKLVKNKTPREVSKIKILDPACGSGSFLLGAYKYLLDWHIDWYVTNLVPMFKEKGSETDPSVKAMFPEPLPRKKGKGSFIEESFPIYKSGEGDIKTQNYAGWKLKTSEKKRILLNNIFGVDIDPQAVEVTKLSLLLKVLAEESSENISKQLKISDERALPSLDLNIKCGNSLVATDIRTPDMLQEDVTRINPFDWDREFSEIMAAGGYDAVIGNPPWGAEFSTIDQEYIRRLYKVASGRNLDSYAVFIEAGLKKLRKGGLLSYITPDTFLRKDDHYELRSLLLNEYSINEIIETGPVFSKVRDTWALVFLLSNQKPQQNSNIFHKNLSRFIVSAEERLERFRLGSWDNNSVVSQELWKKRPYCIIGYLASEKDQAIIAKMEANKRLGELEEFFIISRGEEGSKFLLKEIVDGNFFMVIPKDVGRYTIEQGLKISDKTLTPNKVENFYQHPKIWAIRIQKMRWKQRLVCTLDTRSNSAGMKTLQVIVSTKDDVQNLKFLQGILSSTLMNYYLVNYLADDMNKSYLEKIPIRIINFSDSADNARHAKVVSLVTQMLELNQKLQTARLDQEQKEFRRQIVAIDADIDKLVYELYGLNATEIAIVEGKEIGNQLNNDQDD